MSAPLDCPRLDCWQALLATGLPAEERERYEQHLESCLACQERLDRAEEDRDPLSVLGRQVGDPTIAPADPTLAQVLERLHEGQGPDRAGAPEPPDLYFLRPAGRPDVLGTLGEYEVQEVIGQGGMGVVLKAFEPALHRHVAIKVLAPALAGSGTARRRFTREAQAAAAVGNEHIVAVHGVAEADGLPYLVMQYVAGESLQARLDRAGPLELEEVVLIGLQTAAGLAAAHAQGLIHRDIKPANLLLENGLARVKITDFGLARMVDDVGLTQSGVVAGTPEYMAPEQARGEPVDHRADLFSLGSVLYAMGTGRPPFRGSTAVAVLRRVSDEAPAPIRALNPAVPAWLDALVARLLAKDPADRFQSAAEVAALLEGYLAHLRQPGTVSAPDLPPSLADGALGQPAVAASARWFFWPAAALFVLAAVGLGLLFGFAGASSERDRKTTTYLDDVYQDLRSLRDLTPGFALAGDDASQHTRREPGGLRVTLPAHPGRTTSVAIQTSFSVSGDFEITGTYELLSADTPAGNKPVAGPALWVWGEGKQCARLGRFNTHNPGQVYEVHHTNPRPSQILRLPTGETWGQLRLLRQGTVLSYQVSDRTTPGEFRDLFKTEFGTDDVTMIRLEVDGEDDAGAVDARLIDLRIRSGKQAAERSAAAEPRNEPKRWLTAALLLGLVVTGSMALGVWLYVRQRRRTANTAPSAPGAGKQTERGAAAAFVMVQCPGCGKKLKGKAELAGKEVKCPHCRGAVVVPAQEPGEGGASV
jgi:serine/threonine protein kinase